MHLQTLGSAAHLAAEGAVDAGQLTAVHLDLQSPQVSQVDESPGVDAQQRILRQVKFDQLRRSSGSGFGGAIDPTPPLKASSGIQEIWFWRRSVGCSRTITAAAAVAAGVWWDDDGG
ncbi:hypothetical protein TYRP_012748 [Tyrophagus putrescentiae]|nr:hypothetical protein TYRP_012748 [Tyrophagus putrescentiae]